MPFFRKLAAAVLCAVPLSLAAQAPGAQEPSAPPATTQPDTRVDIPASNAPSAPAIPLQFNQHFTGNWIGTLEYRDYSAVSPDSSAAPPTKLPTTLVMRPSPDGRAVNLEFIYDDGPDKTHPGQRKIVHEREILAFTADTAILTGTSNAQNQAFAVAGVQAFARTGYGTLVLTGRGKENDKAAEFRMTLTLGPGMFTWLKESRAAAGPGTAAGEFGFRDQYTLTPAVAAAAGMPPA